MTLSARQGDLEGNHAAEAKGPKTTLDTALYRDGDDPRS